MRAYAILPDRASKPLRKKAGFRKKASLALTLQFAYVLSTFSRSSASCRSSRGDDGSANSRTSSMVFT